MAEFNLCGGASKKICELACYTRTTAGGVHHYQKAQHCLAVMFTTLVSQLLETERDDEWDPIPDLPDRSPGKTLEKLIRKFRLAAEFTDRYVLVDGQRGVLDLADGTVYAHDSEHVRGLHLILETPGPLISAGPTLSPLYVGRVLGMQCWPLEVVYFRLVMMGRFFAGPYRNAIEDAEHWHLVPFDVGAAGSGKGLLYDFCCRLMGQYHGSVVCVQPALATQFAFAGLVNPVARAVFLNEFRSCETHSIASTLLQCASNEVVQVDVKHNTIVEVKPNVTMWGNGNVHLDLSDPKQRKNKNTRQANSRRYVPFPHLYSAGDKREDTTLAHRIWQEESSAILVTAVQAYYAYRERGRGVLQLPFLVRLARAEASGQLYLPHVFLRTRLTLEPGKFLSSEQVNTAYQEFLNSAGMHDPFSGVFNWLYNHQSDVHHFHSSTVTLSRHGMTGLALVPGPFELDVDTLEGLGLGDMVADTNVLEAEDVPTRFADFITQSQAGVQ